MLAVVVTTVACSNGDKRSDPSAADTAARGEEFDGCRVLMQADARDVLGGTVVAQPKPDETIATATCIWVSEERAHRSLQFSVYPGSDLYGEDEMRGEHGFEPVPDLGDDAFLAEPGDVQLQFLAEEQTVVINVSGFRKAPPSERRRVKTTLVEIGRRVAQWL